jgi:hypothetical protein
MDAKINHLKIIQGVVTRLAGNSFSLKGWSVVLISALFALAATETNILFIFLAYFPAITFWILDGYFLRQERLYRGLYDRVRLLDDGQIDFSMDTSAVSDEVDSWLVVIFSRTLLLFHGTIICSILLVMLIITLIT